MKISEMTAASALTGNEVFEIVQNGQSRKCSIMEIMSAAPDARGVYPDVPLNRIVIKRYSGQTSTIPAIEGNVGLLANFKATAYPVLLDSNSRIAAFLNGNNMRKTADGLNAVLNDPTLQVMTRCGGFYSRYEYNASTNEKIFKFSPYPVKGYKYVRRRFLNCFGGHVADGKLLSIEGVYTTQSLNIQQYHAYAKALGDNYREFSLQDQEVYRMYFWLIEQTFNSQSVINGISNVDWSWWGAFNQSADGGQSQYGQFHKTGFTLDIAGHKGEGSVTVNNGSSDTTVKPYKWLWRENMLSGPYWIWATGYLKKAGVWYRCKDLSKIAFTVTSDYEAICDEAAKGTSTTEGYILENFEDTIIPTQLGGTATTGHCDNFWRAANPADDTVYVPAVVGSANNGSGLGVSVLYSSYVASSSSARCGGALASDDPTDTIADGTIVA